MALRQPPATEKAAKPVEVYDVRGEVVRVIVAKNLRAAQNGTIIGAVLKMLVPLIVTIPGLLGLAVLLNPDGTPLVLVPESDPRANITHRTFNDVLPLLMGQYLGPGLLGLGVTAMIAGFMSGMAGNVSAFATVWTHDVYKPLLNKHAPDAHYLKMGRWCSLLGVLISIATAYALFYFSNILEFLQVLVFFFIVPLFGTVLLGMLWKRATPAAGFWGFLCASVFSIGMWVYVHSFPDGWRPNPKVSLGAGAVVTLEQTGAAGAERITSVVVESGNVELLNVPASTGAGQPPVTTGQFTVAGSAVALAPTTTEKGVTHKVPVLAPEVVLANSKQPFKFGVEAVPIVLKPGVSVTLTDVTKTFAPAAFNPAHAKRIARSEKAQGMAINMYSAWWSFVVCVLVTVGVSLFTKPKPEAELKDLVMGLTKMPDDGPVAWHENPKLWATLVLVALVGINILFW